MNIDDVSMLEYKYEQILVESYINSIDDSELLNEGAMSAIYTASGLVKDFFGPAGKAFLGAWLTHISHYLMVGFGVLAFAKLLAVGMKFGAKYLDKHIEEKEKMIDNIVGELHGEIQATAIKEISKKLENGETITDKEMEQLTDVSKDINEKIRERLEQQYKQGRKEKIAQALYIASGAIESQIGLIGSVLSGMWVFSTISKNPAWRSGQQIDMDNIHAGVQQGPAPA